MKLAFSMFARCPDELSQPLTTEAGVGKPMAMFSPQLPVTPHAAIRSPVDRATGGAGSACAM